MKPFVQRLPLSEDTSFVARTYTTPLFETTWHQHPDIELILQIKGKGLCFIGNYVGEFTAGDIFLLGPNLPHEFRKGLKETECSVMVIHFQQDFLGSAFWNLPESREVVRLLSQSTAAIKLNRYRPALADTIMQLENATGFERIALLCQCLWLMSREKKKQLLSTHSVTGAEVFADDKINRVFAHTIRTFQEAVALPDVAAIANMSVSAFCRYFKRNTKKTYIEFLLEMRLGHACHLLVNTDNTVIQIAYDSGFNTLANFNKQFLKIKGARPSVYRKKFRVE